MREKLKVLNWIMVIAQEKACKLTKRKQSSLAVCAGVEMKVRSAWRAQNTNEAPTQNKKKGTEKKRALIGTMF